MLVVEYLFDRRHARLRDAAVFAVLLLVLLLVPGPRRGRHSGVWTLKWSANFSAPVASAVQRLR